MAITINKQIYANGWTCMASFSVLRSTKWHRSRKLFSNIIIIPIYLSRLLSLCLISFMDLIRSIGFISHPLSRDMDSEVDVVRRVRDQSFDSFIGLDSGIDCWLALKSKKEGIQYCNFITTRDRFGIAEFKWRQCSGSVLFLWLL